jgi:hypothetical protein
MKILLLQRCGLGNQLFQYAAGLFFAKKYKAVLELLPERDDRLASFGHPRPFLLSNFCISARVRERNSWDCLLCSRASRLKISAAASARLVSQSGIFWQHTLQRWTFFSELPVLPTTRNFYLYGDFQVYQFAQDMEERIRKEIVLRQPASGKNLETLEQIRTANYAVSLHIRRGDYTIWRDGQRVLPLAYYERAIRTIYQGVDKPIFFVFSDDIAFARENLPKSERMIFVDNNSEANPHEDLRLMCACRHHIIANSTFSWWGAWLNPDPSKLVCAPLIWQQDEFEAPYPDIIPPGWLKV